MEVLKKSKWEMIQFQLTTFIFTIIMTKISGDYIFLTLNIIPCITFIVASVLYKHIKKEADKL